MKKISNFICWCGGANLSILAQCPEERGKFESIGTGVILTALLSMVSMGFALYSLFTEVFPKKDLILGSFMLLWAVIIFSIDWSLVKTMIKRESPTLSQKINYAMSVLFRFIVAAVISFTVSKPLEVSIFQSRLGVEVDKNREAIFNKEKNEIREEEMRDSSSLAIINNDDVELTKIFNAGCQDPRYLELKKLIDLASSDISQILATVKNINKENADLNNNKNCYDYDANGVKVNMNNECYAKLKKNKQRISNLQMKKNEAQTRLDQYKPEADELYSKWRKNIDERIDLNRTQKHDTQNSSYENEKIRRERRKAFDESATTYKPNLMTYIEAIHTLENREEGRYVFYVRWLLFLVILLVDCAPIIIKLLTKRGTYERIVERIEHERKLEQNQLTFLADREKISNDQLINDIAIIQHNLMREAMEHYYLDERNNMKDRFSKYFTSEQKNNE